jgi:tetratricopeptide (TPR) repeat protein
MTNSIKQGFLMSKSFVLSAVLAVATATLVSAPAAVHAAEPAAAGKSVSPAAAKPLKASKEASDTKNWAVSISKAQEALALPNKTPYDAYVAYQLLAYAYAQQGNAGEALKALQGQVDSGAQSPAEQSKTIKYMFNIAYQQKNYAQAVEVGNRIIRDGEADADTYGIVGHSLYQQGKYADASKFLDDYVDDQERKGQVPRESTLNVLRGSQDKLGNKNGVIDTLEKLVVHYPKPDYWDILLYTQRRDPKLTERQTLQVYRLMQATNTLKQATDFTEMADLAANAGVPGEAQRTLEQGLAANVFVQDTDKARATRLLTSARKSVAADQAGIVKLEADAKAAKTGDLAFAAGAAHYGTADYPKAIDALNLALTKGGLKNPPEVQMMLGISQLRANNKAEAIKTFKSIKTEDPLTQRIAKLWVLYAS